MLTFDSSEDAIFRIGKVVSVDGRTVSVKVDKAKNTSHLLYRGELLRNVAVGSYVKIAKGFTAIIGKVDGEFVTEDKSFAGSEYASQKERIDRTLTVKLLGFFEGLSFKRGIKELPLIDNECFVLKNEEFNQVHNFLKKDDKPIRLGTLALEKGQSIDVGIDGLFASHIGIFGNTGSGKSYTLARIYRGLFETYKDHPNFIEKAKFFLLDFNGEYVDEAQKDIIIEEAYKNVYILSTRMDNGDRFPIPLEALNGLEFWSIFLEATDKTQKPFLRRALQNDYFSTRTETENRFRGLIADMILSVTTKDDRNIEKGIVPSFLKDLSDCLGGNESLDGLSNDFRDKLLFHSQGGTYFYQNGPGPENRVFSNSPNFRSDVVEARTNQVVLPVNGLDELDRVRLRIVLQYYDDVFRGYSNREHLAPLIKRLESRIRDLKKVIKVGGSLGDRNFTIVSLKDVNIHLRKMLPLLLCKRLYDDQKAGDDGRTYLNIIVDEAHNILSEESTRESEAWKDYRLETFEEIIKEGRKFGVFLTIASQRPADISATIISQLHHYFLHRLINDQDIRAVERTISYLDKVSFEYLPILPTGTCIFAGLLANVPIVIDIEEMDSRYEPKNKTRSLTDKWQ